MSTKRKPFYKTSEFWGTILTAAGGVAAAAAGLVAAPVAAVLVASATGFYAVSRAITKHRDGDFQGD